MKEIFHKAEGLRQPYPRVGVVIVTWNRKDYVLRLLDSIRRNAYPNWSVLVVDNASSDGSDAAIRREHPWVRCLRNPVNLGGSGGFNTGLRHYLDEGYDYVWLLDNDVEVEPGALEVLIETLEIHRDAGGAPSVELHGAALALAAERGIDRWHLSMTHTATTAAAFVVGDALGDDHRAR